MNCAFEIASGGMTYTPSFITIGSGVQILLGEICIQTRGAHTHTHTQIQTARLSHKPTFIFSTIREVG
jgi:hypothetical protein